MKSRNRIGRTRGRFEGEVRTGFGGETVKERGYFEYLDQG
jgi:hypothetical protein